MSDVELATFPDYDHLWWSCVCGNHPAHTGFEFSDTDVRIYDAAGDDAADWPGVIYQCMACGRLLDVTTLDATTHTIRVVGRIS